MEPAPREDAGKNIPRGDALAILAANADREIYFRSFGHVVITVSLAARNGLAQPALTL
jgi:hypothetical protein